MFCMVLIMPFPAWIASGKLIFLVNQPASGLFPDCHNERGAALDQIDHFVADEGFRLRQHGFSQLVGDDLEHATVNPIRPPVCVK